MKLPGSACFLPYAELMMCPYSESNCSFEGKCIIPRRHPQDFTELRHKDRYHLPSGSASDCKRLFHVLAAIRCVVRDMRGWFCFEGRITDCGIGADALKEMSAVSISATSNANRLLSVELGHYDERLFVAVACCRHILYTGGDVGNVSVQHDPAKERFCTRDVRK